MLALLLAAVTITEADAGKEVRVARGAEFKVELRYAAGTGYGWYKVPDPAFEQIGEREYRGDGKKGGQRTVTIRFRAVKAGRHELRFEHRRLFERGKAPDKTFKTTVVVE